MTAAVPTSRPRRHAISTVAPEAAQLPGAALIAFEIVTLATALTFMPLPGWLVVAARLFLSF